jgi:hypothetical protein
MRLRRALHDGLWFAIRAREALETSVLTRSIRRSALVLVAAVAMTAPFAACGAGGLGGGGGGESEGGEDGGGGPAPGGAVGGVVVLAANDLGMHCMDREFATFAILPPFNVVRSQVVRRTASGPQLLDSATVRVTYDAVADATGSSNGHSIGKTDFWAHANAIFGASLLPGQGLTGLFMPGDAPVPGPQGFGYDAVKHWWAAAGIPITPTDDRGGTNTYPLMRIAARDASSGAELAHLDVVVPVAQETECRVCHRTGGIGSVRAGVTWSAAADGEVQAKENILLLHDAAVGTALMASRPVLCASCHYSPALDLAGSGPVGPQATTSWFSRAIHKKHDFLPGAAQTGCYACHPGAVTQCARGAMITAGLECKDCHGDMKSIAAEFPLLAGGSLDGAADRAARRAWTDLPRCQSCHTGDALSHRSGTGYVASPDGIRLRQAWVTGDAAASAILATTSRFAENPNTLSRFSKGHGGLLCQTCHGSTHAEWPVANAAANDNVAAVSMQGHAGVIVECGVCHAAGELALTLQGPHGMHNVGDSRWANGGHGNFYENNPSACLACHGVNREGTVLARARADRAWGNIRQGDEISCTRCHGWPPGD